MADPKLVYVVGQFRSGEWPNIVWELQGVFLNWSDAISACRNKYYFVVTVPLNTSLPDEPIELPTVFPHIRTLFHSFDSEPGCA